MQEKVVHVDGCVAASIRRIDANVYRGFPTFPAVNRTSGEPAMNWSNSVFSLRLIAAIGLAFALLVGCKPHETHGTVDEANAVTLEDIAKLGVEQARAKYAGKIVTFKGPMVPVGVRAKNEERKNVCTQGFLLRFPTNQKVGTFESASLRVYFNYGEEIDGWFENKPHRPEDLKLENPLTLGFDVCDTAGICNEGDAKQECRFNSEKLLVTGKVAAIYSFESDNRTIDVYIRPTGIRY